MIITHIIKKSDWDMYKDKTYIKTNTLEEEGFVHCSNIEQVCEVANSLFKGDKNLLLLFIDSSKLINRVVWEDLYNLNEEYPHIYGMINTTSVVGIYDFSPNIDGYFEFSKEVVAFIITF